MENITLKLHCFSVSGKDWKYDAKIEMPTVPRVGEYLDVGDDPNFLYAVKEVRYCRSGDTPKFIAELKVCQVPYSFL